MKVVLKGEILILEQKCVNVWEFMSKPSLREKLHFKSTVIDLEFCEKRELFIVLLETGEIIVINSNGRVVARFLNRSSKYVAIALCEDYLYSGCTIGEITIYALNSCKVLKTLLCSYRCPIKFIVVSLNNLTVVCYVDSTTQVLNHSGELLHSNFAHAGTVHSVAWTKNWSFVSASDGERLYTWGFSQNKWRLQTWGVSSGTVEVTAVAVNANDGTVACGLSSGTVKLFKSYEEVTVVNSKHLGVDEVVDLEFSGTGDILGVCFMNGEAALTDPGFRYEILQLEGK